MPIVVQHGVAPELLSRVAYLSGLGEALSRHNELQAQLSAQAAQRALGSQQHREDLAAAQQRQMTGLAAQAATQENMLNRQLEAEAARQERRAVGVEQMRTDRAAAVEEARANRALATQQSEAESDYERQQLLQDQRLVAQGRYHYTDLQRQQLHSLDNEEAAVMADENLRDEDRYRHLQQVRRKRLAIRPQPVREWDKPPDVGQQWEENSVTLPGGAVVWRDPDGKFQYRPPPRPATGETPEQKTAREAATAELRADDRDIATAAQAAMKIGTWDDATFESVLSNLKRRREAERRAREGRREAMGPAPPFESAGEGSVLDSLSPEARSIVARELQRFGGSAAPEAGETTPAASAGPPELKPTPGTPTKPAAAGEADRWARIPDPAVRERARQELQDILAAREQATRSGDGAAKMRAQQRLIAFALKYPMLQQRVIAP